MSENRQDRQDRLDPKAREKLKAMIEQAVKVMSDIKHLQGSKSDIVSEMAQQFKIPKKTLNQMIKARFNKSYADMQHEHEDFEYLYESIFEVKSSVDGETA